MMRLQKYLAHAGICSRRKAEEHISKGRVSVNGKVVTHLGTKVEPGQDTVAFDHHQVCLKPSERHVYVLVNKPPGIVTSCSQPNEVIITDLIDLQVRLYPVGRLDKDSCGLVLMTNDGELHNRLSHPSFDHEKEYLVTVAHPLKQSALKKMAKGMTIGGVKTRKAEVEQLSPNKFRIVLKQGLNRQIRKMVGKTGNRVVMLKRVRMSGIRLGNLKEGNWRRLSSDEIRRLTQ